MWRRLSALRYSSNFLSIPFFSSGLLTSSRSNLGHPVSPFRCVHYLFGEMAISLRHIEKRVPKYGIGNNFRPHWVRTSSHGAAVALLRNYAHMLSEHKKTRRKMLGIIQHVVVVVAPLTGRARGRCAFEDQRRHYVSLLSPQIGVVGVAVSFQGWRWVPGWSPYA
jgi:hypothetical protein